MRAIQLAVVHVVVLIMAGQVRADVITFDEIPATNNLSVGSTIGDFTIVPDLAGVFDMADIGPAYSGSNYMINWNSRVGRIESASPFDFVGAFMKGDGRFSGTTTVNFIGRDASNSIQFTATRTLGETFSFETFNWSGISAFEWDPVSPDSTNVNIDDFTFNAAAETSPVPEPTSLALLATGALGFMGYGWRRKRKLAA